MPYGIENETKEQTKWMDGCVGSIKGTNKRTGKPFTKGEKIAICKVQLKKKGSSEAYGEESLREQFYDFEDKIRNALTPDVREVGVRGPWVVDIFDDYIITEVSDKMYKVPYTIKGDDVTFDWTKAIEVERVTSYEPVVEAEEREIVTKVPYTAPKDGGRIRTYGGQTIT